MKLLDSFRKFIQGERLTSADTRPPRVSGRVSVDNDQDVFISALSMLTPAAPDYENYWRDYKLDAKSLDKISTTKLMQLLADMSPDVSRALWDFLRLCNPGYEVKAYNPGSEETINQKAQDAINAFLGNLHGPYTITNTVPADTVINALFIAAFLRGAFFAELVLDEAGRMPLELATPDPASVRFRKVFETGRGPAWQMGQWQKGEFVPLDRPTVAYVPVDPFPGSPYGRPMATPALFASLFLLGLLHDLRRVVAQQGYPRLDIAVDMEKLKAAMPSDLAKDPKAAKEWANAAISEIISTYSELEPDDAYVHPDFVVINKPVGTVDSSSLGAVDGLITGLERMLVRALKTMPLLMGTAGSGDQSQANRQWEIMAAGIKSLQHGCESLLERLLTIGLQVQGIQADVEFRFAELRAAELLRDAQVEAFNIKNARAKYDNGWISQDEAAQAGAGKEKADAPEPRAGSVSLGNALPSGGMAADPGSERKRGKRAVQISPEGSNDPLPAVPNEVEFSDADEQRAVDDFDSLMDVDFQGLLDATVINKTDFEQ